MNALTDWTIRRYSSASISQRLYGLAILTFVIGQLLTLRFGDLILDVATTLAMALIIGGFAIWCFPAVRWLHGAWDRPLAKIPIVQLHILVLLVATVLARSMVAEALALPPQSFDVTVGFLVLLCYLPAWMLIAALILALAGVILMVIPLLLMPLSGVQQQVALLLRAFGGKVTVRRTRFTVLLHGFGAFSASMILLQSYAYLATNHQARLYPLIRMVAIKSDFHPASLYPGAQTGELIHPLENGFAAFALVRADGSTVITVRTQEALAEPWQIAAPTPSAKLMFGQLIERIRRAMETSPLDEPNSKSPSP